MIIPADNGEREAFYDELIGKCFLSRPERSAQHARLRNFYLFGTHSGQRALFNKIQPHIDLLTSFLFSSETTRFSMSLGAGVSTEEYKKMQPLSRAVQDEWLRANIDMTFGEALKWALVSGSSFIKLFWRQGLHAYLVESHQVGVLREDAPYLDRQECIAHRYSITESELRYRLTSHPNREKILARVQFGGSPQQDAKPSGLMNVIINSVTPTITGVIDGRLSGSDYLPEVDESLINMTELWIWNDEIDDYQTVTMADPGVVIYDRRNIFVTGEQPLVQIVPSPLYNYFWGESEVDRLTLLQEKRSARMDEIINLLTAQLKPPTVLTGQWGIQDEKEFAFGMPGSFLSSDDAQAKMERFAPDLPNDVFAEIKEIDTMVDEASGITSIMQGMGEKGVRGRGHADALARLGSTRAKRRALIVEDSLEKIATLTLRCIQKYDDRRLMDEDGNPFIAEQFTKDYVMKVDAHSNSPIFVEDQRDIAGVLFEAKAIDRRTLIEMMNPPSLDLLLLRLKVIEAKEDAQAKAEADAKAQSSPGGQANA